MPFIYDETGYEYNKLDLLSVKKDGHSGFVNKTGAVIFPVIYESLNDDFDGGLCLARKDGKWGYLDQNGKTVIPFEYDEASPFYSGKTKVKKANTWYEIDKTGKILSQSPDKN
ncbi:MAG: WG repeat-containing protein [Bacteroidota bacterium]